jgi:hypothetical protein
MSFIKTMSIFRQILQMWETAFFERWLDFNPKYSGYAVGYGLETIIGPIEIKYSSPENAKGYTWFSIGFCFNCNVIQFRYLLSWKQLERFIRYLQFLIKRNPE